MLPAPGTHSFFPALLQYARDASLGQFPIDSVILQCILLCLIAGGKHLILNVDEDDVGHVTKLTTLVLSSIFGLNTHKVKIRHSTTTTAFIRSLFLPSPSTPHEDSASTKRKSTSSHHSRRIRSKSRHQTARSPLSITYTRSLSFPNHIVPIPPDAPPDQYYRLASTSTAIEHDPLPSDSATEVAILDSPKRRRRCSQRPGNRQANTDPTPLPLNTTPLYRSSELPQALVISGIEHASSLSQRALSDVLTERKVVLEGDQNDFTALDDLNGVWTLPEGFILVSVCTVDPRERPNIHKALLDKFAMSATVNLQANTRMSLRSSSLSQMLSPQTYRSSAPSYFSVTPKGSPASSQIPLPIDPILPPHFIDDLRTHFNRTKITPLLSLYISDLFSAARHHPQLDGTFLTLRSMNDAQDLIRAARVLGGDLTGVELILGMSQLSTTDDLDSDMENGKREVDEYATMFEDMTNGSETIRMSLARSASSAARSVEEVSDIGSLREFAPSELDVSEADVARMIPRIITHRVRVRDGPDDEILGSAIAGAVLENKAEKPSRVTIKEVMIRILAEV